MAIPYIRRKITPAMMKRSIQFDSLVLGLRLFRVPSYSSLFAELFVVETTASAPVWLTEVGDDCFGQSIISWQRSDYRRSNDHEDDDKGRLEGLNRLGVYLQP